MASVDPSTDLGKLIQQVSGYLAPQGLFTDQNTWQQPYNALFSEYEKNMLKPYWERFTFQPWQKNYAGGNVGSLAMQMGNNQANYGNAKAQQQMDYTKQASDAQNSFSDLLQTNYNKLLNQFNTSPTAFNNIGTTT